MPPTETVPKGLAIRHHTAIGCSTGFVEQDPEDWEKLVLRMSEWSNAAVELSALSEPELPGLVTFLQSWNAQLFDFVSVHAPSKHREMADEVLVLELKKLPESVQAIVVHPDSINDPKPYEQLGSGLVIENLDVRNQTGKTVDQLRAYFDALPDARFCLDVAHVKSIDPSMQLGMELLDAFRNRLSHLHLSSLDDDCHHVSLTEEDEQLFAQLLDRCRDVPWILEAAPRD